MRQIKKWALAAGLAVSLGTGVGEAAVSQYFLGRPMRWNFSFYDAGLLPVQNPATLAIRYTLAAEGWSAGNRTAELNAVRSAFAQWQAVSGTQVRFEEFGSVSGASDVDPLDGVNLVVWLAGNRLLDVNGQQIFFPATARGITVLSGSDADETIAEADIVLNRSLTWFTDFNAVRMNDFFVEEVALHEIGHLLGFNHATLGGATMFWTNPGGVDHTAGLSADEAAGLKALYGTPAGLAAVGRVTGRITLNGGNVLGAMVTLEDAQGNVVTGTATLADGTYALGGVPPGSYTLRVTPLDPPASGDTFLVRGNELDTAAPGIWNSAATGFLPVTNLTATVTAGGTVTRNVTVTGGNPPFRITEMRRGLNQADRASGDFCAQLRPGVAGQWVGVYVPGLAADSGAVLRLTGEGVAYGETQVVPNALRSLTLVQVPVTVAGNAVAGLRSLTVTANGFTAWANGFAEILPTQPDFNFDGLDDLFQRRHFDPFTRAEAAPEADPDGDGFVNRREAVMGSDPTSAASVNWRIVSAKLTAQGTTVTWESAPGRRYQLFGRDRLAGSAWQAVGNPVQAAGETTQAVDPALTDQLRFYQVRDVP